VIASIFEFSGAFFLGASVTGTIRSKIVDVDLYEDEPSLLMFGMLSALISANIFLAVATAFGMPVSTTHDIVGSIMGFSIAAKGFDSVKWKVAIMIFISWVVSPLFAGAVAAAIFATVKYAVLRSPNPYRRAYWTFPIVLTGGIGINIFYVLYKASSNFKNFHDRLELYIILPVAFGTGAICGLIWLYIIGPIAKRHVEAKREAREEIDAAKEVMTLENRGDSEVLADDVPFNNGEIYDVDQEPTKEAPLDATAGAPEAAEPEAVAPAAAEPTSIFGKLQRGFANATYDRDIEMAAEFAAAEPTSMFGKLRRNFAGATYDRDIEAESMRESKRAVEIWAEAEDFDVDTENLFTYLQVFTACLNSFAHGANDVSNTLAPMSAIITIYQTGKVPDKSPVPKWMLAFGGGAIVVGLLLYGYNVMKSLGYKLTKLSPSRGFSAELGASLVVVTASFNEIPVSSTQCIVGAIFGVGLVGGCHDVQWWFLLKVMTSWGGLFLGATIFAAGIFSFGAFSPTA
jgi:solute carrier family 20 (sodium-dependent phosphate transporter)